MLGAIAFLSKSFAAFPGHAARAADHSLLPFATRAANGLFALAILSLPLLLIALLVVIPRSHGRTGKRLALLLTAWITLIAAGALIAATDPRNERGWNPALYGAVFAAAAFPAAIAAGLPGDDERRTGAILCAGIAAFPVTLLIAAVGPIFVEWGLRHGWPVGW